MAKKRRDKKGRVLRKGESQRKDSLYQYRYTDGSGKRHTIYSPDLNTLREKEDEIDKSKKMGVDYQAGEITVFELAEKYVCLRQKGVRDGTKSSYGTVLNYLKENEFGNRKISGIRISDAKQWVVELAGEKKSAYTVLDYVGVLRPAFQMAYEEESIVRNPFAFQISDVIAVDRKARPALTDDQVKRWLDFVKGSKRFSRYYDIYVILLETGIRISEFCGLTEKDLDFENRRIRIDHQLLKKTDGSFYISKPKTDNGIRYIRMTEEVYQALRRILEKREKNKVEPVVDGYSGFLVMTRTGKPMCATGYDCITKRCLNQYRNAYPDAEMPEITPHVFRHTFCTNMVKAGMNPKALQYLMGHSSVNITLNLYTHIRYEHVSEEMEKVEGRLLYLKKGKNNQKRGVG